jgi:hypothetical protein
MAQQIRSVPPYDAADTQRIGMTYRNRSMKIGEDYIWSVRGRGLLLKQAGPDRLISLNPDYPDILLSEDEGAAVVGRVVSRVEKEMIVPPDVESLYWEAMEVR